MYIKTHALFGASSVILLINPAPEILLPCLAFSTLGSIMPDIDHEHVAKTKVIPSLMAIVIFSLIMKLFNVNEISSYGSIAFVFLCFIAFNSKHRTFTHSLLGAFLFSVSIYNIIPRMTIPFAIGYVTHIIADSFTRTGVPIFFPYKKSAYGLKIFNTRETTDLPFFLISIVILLAVMIYRYN